MPNTATEKSTQTLTISDDLSLPIDAVTQTFAFLGRRGSGKTYGAGKLAELMLGAGAQVVVLDPIGVWYGLRLSADGKGKGFSVPVFGGEHGDVPLEPQAGALIAKLLVEERFSAVLDVSTFRKEQRKQFVTDLAEELMHRKKTHKSAMHVFFEESQLFIPQRVTGKEARMVGAFEDLIKLGRNYGIGASLISQRPQAVNKDVLNQTECLLAFQMTGPQERKTVEDWISDKGIGENIKDLLPGLRVGEVRLWSPQWLRISETIKIAKKTTFDASSTPTVGAAIVQPRELSPVDVEKIKSSMADVVKRAEADDPKKLKVEIARLTRELETERKAIPLKVQDVVTEIKEVEVPVLPDGLIHDMRTTLEAVGLHIRELQTLETQLNNAIGIVAAFGKGKGKFSVTVDPKSPMLNKPSVNLPAAAPKTRAAVEVGDLKISSTQQRILDALAFYESIGNTSPGLTQIGAVALIDPTGGHFSNVTGPLSSAGLIERSHGTMKLTDAGRAVANVSEAPKSLDEYHSVLRQRVRKMTSASRRTIDLLDSIITAGGQELTTEEIGQAIGIDHTGGHFSNTIGPLSTAGLITRSGGMVRPTEVLFPEGLY